MPLVLETHNALPYIDPDPTTTERETILSTLSSTQPTSQPLHPSIPNLSYAPAFPPLLTAAHASISASDAPRAPSEGVDMSRYEAPSAPDPAAQPQPDAWRAALGAAGTAHAHLAQRALALGLLERYGRNAWLMGNAELEAEVRAAKGEAEAAREGLSQAEEERRRLHDAARGTLQGLEGEWRGAVGRAIEVEIEGEAMRQRVVERRMEVELEARKGGGGG